MFLPEKHVQYIKLSVEFDIDPEIYTEYQTSLPLLLLFVNITRNELSNGFKKEMSCLMTDFG